FDYDESRVLLVVMQRGYWSMDIFRAFETGFLALHEQIRDKHPNYRGFAECAEYQVQSNEVGLGFAGLLQKLMDENKGDYGSIAGSTHKRSQAKRVIPQENVEVFTDRNEAMAWLLEPGSLAG